ncbi:MAG TPA: DUF3276 family protein [Brumimicrobium sp.]|nr:DUF3276 family protein [Brumimicrobium sp.]
MNEEQNYENKQEVHSTVVRAGKRTYFFDVKETKNKDLYLTVTESKKSIVNGKTTFQKHKIFLYKEDFEKFSEALGETIEKISELKQDEKYADDNVDLSDFTSVDFEDLP